MATALAIFGSVFAALCVWLTVRIVNWKERCTKCALALAIGVPALYVASFGPACWITSRLNLSGEWLIVAYSPVVEVLETRSGPLFRLTAWYSYLGSSDNWGWLFDGDGCVVAFAVEDWSEYMRKMQ